MWYLQLSDDPWLWNRSLHSPHSILVKTIFKAEQAASLLQLSKQGPRLTLFYTHLLVDTTQLWSLHRAKGQFGWLPVFIWVSNQHLYLATAKIEFFISSILSVNGLTTHLIQVLSFPYPYPYSQSSQTQLISKLAQWYLKNSKMVHVAAFSWFCPWPGATSSLWKYSNSPQTGGTTLTPLPTHKPGKSLKLWIRWCHFPAKNILKVSLHTSEYKPTWSTWPWLIKTLVTPCLSHTLHSSFCSSHTGLLFPASPPCSLPTHPKPLLFC